MKNYNYQDIFLVKKRPQSHKYQLRMIDVFTRACCGEKADGLILQRLDNKICIQIPRILLTKYLKRIKKGCGAWTEGYDKPWKGRYFTFAIKRKWKLVEPWKGIEKRKMIKHQY